MKYKRNLFLAGCLIFSQLFRITAYAKPAWPSDVGIVAETGIVYDMDSDTMIFGQNSRVASPPASITKLLTALVVLENCGLDDTVTFTESAMSSIEAGSGNRLNLVAGDELTVRDCLYALLLVSSNQAANALAEHTAGSISAFADMMNERIARLGCTDSHFENPSGLNGDTQYVTAYDMALISQAAFSNEDLLEISSTLTYKIGPTINNPDGATIQHEHRLLYTEDPNSQYYYPPAVAGKTGYLILAGNTLVTYAEQDGRRLISVILKGTPRQYFVDGKNLLQFGFERFENISISQQETRYITGDEPLTINGLTYRPSDLMIEPDRMITVPKGASFDDVALELAALPEGDHPANAVAMLRYTYDDRRVGWAYLLAGEVSVDVKGENKETAPGGETANGGEAAQPPGTGEDSPAEAPAGGNVSAESHFPIRNVLAASAIFLAVVLAGGSIAWITYSRQKEAKARAQRRAARLKRIQDSGDEEEFNRLLEERRAREHASGKAKK